MNKMNRLLAEKVAEGRYESPACMLFEIVNEGVLCSSTPFTINDWVENNDVL